MDKNLSLIRYLSFVESSIKLKGDGFDLEILEHIFDFEREMYSIRFVPPSELDDIVATRGGFLPRWQLYKSAVDVSCCCSSCSVLLIAGNTRTLLYFLGTILHL